MTTPHSITNPPVAAAILAGGAARRMGGANKSALKIGDRAIFERQLAVLRPLCDPVIVVANDDARVAGYDLTRVGDLIPGAGPLGGLLTAIVASHRDRTLVVACDLPFLSTALVERLIRPSQADVVIPHGPRGYEPLCATWRAGCEAAVRQRIAAGRLDVVGLLPALQVEEIGAAELAVYDPHGLLFVNVNTSHDFERAQELSRLEGNR